MYYLGRQKDRYRYGYGNGWSGHYSACHRFAIHTSSTGLDGRISIRNTDRLSLELGLGVNNLGPGSLSNIFYNGHLLATRRSPTHHSTLHCVESYSLLLGIPLPPDTGNTGYIPD